MQRRIIVQRTIHRVPKKLDKRQYFYPIRVFKILHVLIKMLKKYALCFFAVGLLDSKFSK